MLAATAIGPMARMARITWALSRIADIDVDARVATVPSPTAGAPRLDGIWPDRYQPELRDLPWTSTTGWLAVLGRVARPTVRGCTIAGMPRHTSSSATTAKPQARISSTVGRLQMQPPAKRRHG